MLEFPDGNSEALTERPQRRRRSTDRPGGRQHLHVARRRRAPMRGRWRAGRSRAGKRALAASGDGAMSMPAIAGAGPVRGGS